MTLSRERSPDRERISLSARVAGRRWSVSGRCSRTSQFPTQLPRFVPTSGTLIIGFLAWRRPSDASPAEERKHARTKSGNYRRKEGRRGNVRASERAHSCLGGSGFRLAMRCRRNTTGQPCRLFRTSKITAPPCSPALRYLFGWFPNNPRCFAGRLISSCSSTTF